MWDKPTMFCPYPPPPRHFKQSRCGIASLAIFASATLVLIVLYARVCIRQGTVPGAMLGALFDRSYLTWTASSVPIFLLGVVLGAAGVRQAFRQRRLSWWGLMMNSAMLVPAKILPWVGHFLNLHGS